MSAIQIIAQSLRDQLAPACERIEIAGSIRRGKPNPKDIELVAIARVSDPMIELDLFGNPVSEIECNHLHNKFIDILDKEWEFDPDVRRNGPKYKRLRHIETHVCCDLFITTPECWGAIFTIRTGPGDFSKELVTLARRRGMLVEGGNLYRVHRNNQRDLIPTPEETDFFKALGVPWLEPRARTAEKLLSLRSY